MSPSRWPWGRGQPWNSISRPYFAHSGILKCLIKYSSTLSTQTRSNHQHQPGSQGNSANLSPRPAAKPAPRARRRGSATHVIQSIGRRVPNKKFSPQSPFQSAFSILTLPGRIWARPCLQDWAKQRAITFRSTSLPITPAAGTRADPPSSPPWLPAAACAVPCSGPHSPRGSAAACRGLRAGSSGIPRLPSQRGTKCRETRAREGAAVQELRRSP